MENLRICGFPEGEEGLTSAAGAGADALLGRAWMYPGGLFNAVPPQDTTGSGR
jgi:hypothetical protein